MSTPITWRSVQGPSLSEASRPMELAQRGFSTAFDQLGQLIAQREGLNQGVLDRGREDERNSFLDTLQGARTPEDMNALRLSGVLQQRLQAMDPRTRATLRGAEEARTDSLAQRQAAAQIRDDATLARTDAPIRDAFLVAIARGDEAAQAKLYGDNPNLRNLAPIVQADKAAELQLKNTLNADDDRSRRLSRQKITEAREDALAPVTQANALSQGALTGLQLTAARKQAADSAIVNDTVTSRLQAFNKTNNDYATGLSSIANQIGVPLDASGMPDITAMDAGKMERFSSLLKKANLGAPPTSSEARKQIRDSLVSQGASAAAIAQGTSLADQTFTSKGALSLEDQGTLAKRNALIDSNEAEAKANNLFYTPPKELNQAKINVLGSVEKLITDGPMTKSRLRSKMSTWMNEGLEVNQGGRTVKIPIPPKVVEAALTAGLESNSWVYNSTDADTIKAIEDIMSSPSYNKQREEAEWLQADGHKKAKRDFEESLRTSAGTATPADFLTRFNTKLMQKKAEATSK